MYTSKELEDRANLGNWVITSNNGTTLVARNSATKESFNGTPNAFKTMLNSTGAGFAEPVYTVDGKFGGFRNKDGSEYNFSTLVSGALNPKGIGQHVIAPPVAEASFTITEESGGTPTVEVVTVNGEQCLRVTASVVSKYLNFVHALPASLPVHSAVVECIAPTASDSVVALYFAQTSGFISTTSISKAATVAAGLNSSQASGIMSCINFTELPSGAPGALTNQWNNAGSLNLQSALFTHMQIRVTPTAGQVASITLRRVTINPSRKGRIAIVADDGRATWWRRALPLLERRGLRCSVSIIPDRVGSSSAFATWDEITRAKDRGHEVLTHGPIGGTGNIVANYATVAESVADAVSSRSVLDGRGLLSERGKACYIWPQGTWQATTGQTEYLDAMQAAGFTLGRSVTRYIPCSVVDASRTKYSGLMLPIIGHIRGADSTAETTVINNIVSCIQACAASGLDGVLMFHDIIDAGGGYGDNDQIEVDRFITILDAIVTQIAAGRAENVLFSDMAV